MGIKAMTFDGKAVKSITVDGGVWFEQSAPPPSGQYVLYDNGYVDGVEWVGNRLPHKSYYNASVCGADFSHAEAEDGGYIRLYLNGSYQLQYNTHVCTSAAVRVPDDATAMKVEVSKGVNQIDMRFGLMPEDCTNSLDTTNGGVLTSTEYISTSGKHTYTLNLPAGFAGGSWVPVVNAFEAANQLSELNVYKIWFE